MGLLGGGQVRWPVPTQKTTQTQNKCSQTYKPRVGFKPTTTMVERAGQFMP
jgi:hypothetical protein